MHVNTLWLKHQVWHKSYSIWKSSNHVACTVNHRPAYRLSPTHLLAQDFQLLVGAGGHWNGDHGDPGCRGCWGTPWTPWSRRWRTGSSQASQPARRSPSWAPERRATRATRATLAVATGWLVAPWADLRRFASHITSWARSCNTVQHLKTVATCLGFCLPSQLRFPSLILCHDWKNPNPKTSRVSNPPLKRLYS